MNNISQQETKEGKRCIVPCDMAWIEEEIKRLFPNDHGSDRKSRNNPIT